MDPNDTTLRAALETDVWETVEGRLLTRMVEEFSYGEIVDPRQVETADGDRDTYRFELGDARCRFEATERLMDSLHVHGDTIERRSDDSWEPIADPLTFLRDIGENTDLDGLTEGNLVREYKRTLLADAHIEARRRDRDGLSLQGFQIVHGVEVVDDLGGRLDRVPDQIG